MNAFRSLPVMPSPRAPLAPPRLAEGGGSDYERQLLQSARFDSVPDAAATRVAAALASVLIPAELAAAHVPAPVVDQVLSAAAVATDGAAGKYWATGLLAMSVLGALVADQWSRAPAPVPPASDVVAVDVAAPSVPRPVPSLPPPRAPADEASEKSAPEESSSPRAAAPPRRSSHVHGAPTPKRATPAAPVTPPSGGLLEEVRAVELIQASLGAGQAGKASRELEQYRRRFPDGELALEADVLDVDIKMAEGERTGAAELARALLSRPAAGRYRARLRAVLEDTEAEREPARGSIGGGAHIREPR